MIKSRYLEAFKQMATEAKDSYLLQGEFILVEEIAAEEKKTKGGLFLPDSKLNHDGFGQNRPTLVHVIAVGEGYYDEELPDQSIPLDVKPGDIILVGGQSVKWLSYFGPIISAEGARVGISTAGEVQLKFNGPEGYQKVYETLERANGQQR